MKYDFLDFDKNKDVKVRILPSMPKHGKSSYFLCENGTLLSYNTQVYGKDIFANFKSYRLKSTRMSKIDKIYAV